MTLTPFALAAWVDFVPHSFFGGPLGPPPEILGLSAGGWLQVAFLAWAAVGAYIVWTTHSRLASALALVLFTPVAIFGLVLGPAVLLILQNLGS